MPAFRTIHPNPDIDVLYDIFGVGVYTSAGKDCWISVVGLDCLVRNESNGLRIMLNCGTCLMSALPMEDDSVELELLWSRKGALSRLYALIAKWQGLLEAALRSAKPRGASLLGR